LLLSLELKPNAQLGDLPLDAGTPLGQLTLDLIEPCRKPGTMPMVPLCFVGSRSDKTEPLLELCRATNTRLLRPQPTCGAEQQR
jgi:hypothetical protein